MVAKLIDPGPGPEQKREIPLTKDEFLIGRGADCDLRLKVSAISRHHCLIRLRGDEATVTDLGSSNGTYLNGQRIRSQAVLHSGDELRLDNYVFLVDLADQDGISWVSEAGVDSGAITCKLRDIRKEIHGLDEQERGHPLGEAGGQGDSAGQESR